MSCSKKPPIKWGVFNIQSCRSPRKSTSEEKTSYIIYLVFLENSCVIVCPFLAKEAASVCVEPLIPWRISFKLITMWFAHTLVVMISLYHSIDKTKRDSNSIDDKNSWSKNLTISSQELCVSCARVKETDWSWNLVFHLQNEIKQQRRVVLILCGFLSRIRLLYVTRTVFLDLLRA